MGKDESQKPGGIVPFTLRQPRDDKKDLLRNKGRFSDPYNKDLKNSSGEGSVIPLKRGFHGRDVVVDKEYPREVDKKTCIAFLSGIGPVSEELSALLEIPEKLLMVSNSPSFSLEAERTAAPITNYLLFGTSKPKVLPDYALHISSKGSNVFCTFVDKKRKIVVNDTVNSMYAKEGSWKSFERALERALAATKDYESQGIKFDFVLVRENLTDTLTL